MQARFRFIAISIVCSLIIFIGGCTTKVEPLEFKEMDFSHLPVIVFNVSRIEIFDEYRAPLAEPNVEHNFPIPPTVAIKRWLADRIHTGGTGDILQIFIKDASAKKIELETNKDIEGWFTTEQAERIDARVEVQFKIKRASSGSNPYAAAVAKRSRTVPEGASLNIRDQVYFDLVEALINDFNASMEQSIRQYLEDYLK